MVNSMAGDGHEDGARPPRLPKWSPHELRVLIQGKKAAETRRAAHHVGSGSPEPKWAVVSSYCRRRGVHRSPRQCRKRWDNLARDYKRIKVWECRKGEGGGGGESFWAMRSVWRRERQLPGFFDLGVYAMLDGEMVVEPEENEGRGGAEPSPAAEEEKGALFDSGRAAEEDRLFSDCEEEEEEEEEEEDGEEETAAAALPTLASPISERKPQPYSLGPSESGMGSEEQPVKNTEEGSSSRDTHKRKRPSSGDSTEDHLQKQLMETLERNSRTLAAHLEAQKIHWQLERDQRKDHTDRLVGVLGNLADALGRIADKLPLNGDAKI